MIITIAGNAGSGKSTVSKLLAKKLRYKHYSAGDMQREIAKEQGMSILELGRLEAKDKKYDNMIDARQRRLGKENDNFVIDGWLSAYFIPHSYKVFLTVDANEAVKRRIRQKRKNEQYATLKEAKAALKEREAINRKRWLKYYGFDYADKKNYDLTVNTTKKKPESVTAQILSVLKKKKLL